MAFGQGILAGYTSYIVAGTMIISAIGQYLVGAIDLATMFQRIMEGIAIGTLRRGMDNSALKGILATKSGAISEDNKAEIKDAKAEVNQGKK